MSHLKELEQESIHIIREVCATVENPVVLYSIGKDSSTMLHLFEKAFWPRPVPVPFLHIDTGWKFPEMYKFKEKVAKEKGIKILTYKHSANLNPYKDGRTYTDVMKTQSLKQALDFYKFDAAFGGARRDEEKSRAKERIVSVRAKGHLWDPNHQNPEFPPVYNTNIADGNTLRVFPLSNWTELDIWEYILQEKIEIVPIYFAHKRKVSLVNGIYISDDNGQEKTVRFRTLGCVPLTGAIESNATTVEEIIEELKKSKFTERITRVIDFDKESSMEIKKREGYF